MALQTVDIDPGSAPSLGVAADQIGSAPNERNYQIVKQFPRVLGIQTDVNVALAALPTSLTVAESNPCWLEELWLVNVTDQPQKVSVRDGASGAYLFQDLTIGPRDYRHFKFGAGIQFVNDVRWIAETTNAVNGSIRGMR